MDTLPKCFIPYPGRVGKKNPHNVSGMVGTTSLVWDVYGKGWGHRVPYSVRGWVREKKYPHEVSEMVGFGYDKFSQGCPGKRWKRLGMDADVSPFTSLS